MAATLVHPVPHFVFVLFECGGDGALRGRAIRIGRGGRDALLIEASAQFVVGLADVALQRVPAEEVVAREITRAAIEGARLGLRGTRMRAVDLAREHVIAHEQRNEDHYEDKAEDGAGLHA